MSLTVDQVAALAQLNKRTILDAIHRGELRAWRPTASTLRVRAVDFEAWIEARQVEPSVA